MRSVRVKICGITSPEDADRCHALGADYLGVIFAASPRRVTAARAAEIRAAVPEAKLVGVFADADPDEIVATAHRAGLDLLQLHGCETPSACSELASRVERPLIKVFCHGEPSDPPLLRGYAAASYFLFDLTKGDPCASASRKALWTTARRAVRGGFDVFLAGKLGADNVRDAIAKVDPFCIDVSSGVESTPGVKDLAEVRRFIMEAKGCIGIQA
jgi:phosphoribosylanthranilate isomerase